MIMSAALIKPARNAHDMRVRVTAGGLFVFVCGALNPLTLNLVGEIYAPEILLPIAALVALILGGGSRAFSEKLFWVLLLAAGMTLGGYVLSDLIRETRPDQYVRGWGRVVLLMTDFVALAMLFGQDRRNLWWFSLGMGVGGVVYLRLVMHTPISIWKFGYAEPMVLVAAALGCFLPVRFAAAWLAALGVASMKYDFRSFAAICFVLAAYMWIRAARPWQPLAGNGKLLKALVAGGLAGIVVLIALSATESDYSSQRRAQSDAGRSAAIEVGLIAIARSPLIGYGSWSENRELAQMYVTRYLEKRGIRDPDADVGRHFAPHSQILQSWVEGGGLGAVFFLVLGYQIVRSVKWAVLVRPADMLTPLILYFWFLCAWNFFMSPFSAPHRIHIAISAAVLVLLDSERRASRLVEQKRSNVSSVPESDSTGVARYLGLPKSPG
jgi:hypothetical protein